MLLLESLRPRISFENRKCKASTTVLIWSRVGESISSLVFNDLLLCCGYEVSDSWMVEQIRIVWIQCEPTEYHVFTIYPFMMGESMLKIAVHISLPVPALSESSLYRK